MALDLATPYSSHGCIYQVSTDQYARLGQSNLHGDMQVICVRTKVGLLISVDFYSYCRKML